MNDTTKQMLLSAAIASLVVAGTSPIPAFATNAGGKYKCEGGNGCRGKSACKTASNECSGKNGCKGKGVVMVKNKAACTKLQDKNAKAEAAPAAEAPPPAAEAPAPAPAAETPK